MAEQSAAANIGLPVYLDNQATTAVDPRVLELMLPYFGERFGNPHSRTHAYGWESEEACETARAQVAALIGASPREVVFTSGATESNNLALIGAARFRRAHGGGRDHLVTVATEHKCVIEACRYLEGEGFQVTFLPVDQGGHIDLDRLAETIDEGTLLVSIMGANNEIGVLHPLAEIGALCRARGVLFHSDCAQAVGKMALDVEACKIDLMSISGHKIYGPKGVGALYVRRRPRARLEPLIHGGGQERGLRSGTLAPPLCVGIGAACALAGQELAAEEPRLRALRERLHGGILAALDDVHLNGDGERRLAGNLNLSFAGVDAEALMAAMKDLAVSSGSACTSAAVEPSYVLRALGGGDELAHGSIRFGLGRYTTEGEIDHAIETVAREVRRLRQSDTREAVA